jgi:hypothetical protein
MTAPELENIKMPEVNFSQLLPKHEPLDFNSYVSAKPRTNLYPVSLTSS